MISMIVAMGENNEIGLKNRLPWSMPADLAYFKKITTGHSILMGRKTYESIGKPLPNRKNIVITRQQDYHPDGVEVIHDLKTIESLESNQEVIVIGGAEIYKRCLQFANRLYVTRIHGQFEADTFFPSINETMWQEVQVEHHKADEKNKYEYSFYIYERVDNWRKYV